MSTPSGTVTSPAGRVGKFFVNLAAAFGLLYLFLPIFVIVAFSFNKPKGRFNAVWQEFTFDNWLHPFADKALVDALILSLEIALIAAVIATILGTFIAIALVRYRFRGGNSVNFLLILPLTAPEIVLGASLLTLFLEPHLVLFNINFKLGFTTIVLAHIMFCVSYVALDGQGSDPRLRMVARGRGDGSRRQPNQDVPAGHAALDHPGHPRRVPLVVRALDRRLHHHVLRVGSEHHDVPGADLRSVAHCDPAADQRARIDDPVRQHHRPRSGNLVGSAT